MSDLTASGSLITGSTGSVIIGPTAEVKPTSPRSLALGNKATVETTSPGAVAIGTDSTATGAVAAAPNQFTLGTARHRYNLPGAALSVPNLPTTDPTNAGEVWADNGTLVQSGHTAGGGLSAKSASFTPPATPTTSITVANGANGPIIWGSKTDPTTLITALSTTSWRINQSGLYIINIEVNPVTAMTPGGTWCVHVGTSTHAGSMYVIAPAPPNPTSILPLTAQVVAYVTATNYFNVEVYNRDGVAARKFRAGAAGSCHIQKIA